MQLLRNASAICIIATAMVTEALWIKKLAPLPQAEQIRSLFNVAKCAHLLAFARPHFDLETGVHLSGCSPAFFSALSGIYIRAPVIAQFQREGFSSFEIWLTRM